MDRLVGPANESSAIINGKYSKCLLDTGSQVTTLTLSFYEENLNEIPLRPLEELLYLEGAGNQDVPYFGYIEVAITLPEEHNISGKEFNVLALIVQDGKYNKNVPLLVGTNLMMECREAYREKFGPRFLQVRSITTPWRMAFEFLKEKDRIERKVGKLCSIKAQLKNPLVIHPGQTKVVWGSGAGKWTRRDFCIPVVTEQPRVLLPHGLNVNSLFIKLGENFGKKVPVCLYNNSLKSIAITPKMVIADLHCVSELGDSVNTLASAVAQSTVTAQATQVGKKRR